MRNLQVLFMGVLVLALGSYMNPSWIKNTIGFIGGFMFGFNIVPTIQYLWDKCK